MKSKKLISLLCAAAMSASAFAGLTVTASAATPVYTFDGSDITGFSGNGTLAQVSDDKGEYFSIKAEWQQYIFCNIDFTCRCTINKC